MDEIYLKIYTAPCVTGERVLVFEGCGADDLPGYYPDRFDDEVKRIGNVVVGKEHIAITSEAKEAIKYIVKKTPNHYDNSTYFDIDLYFGDRPDARWRSDRVPQIRIYYGGAYITEVSIEEPTCPIGNCRYKPMLELLDELPVIDQDECEHGYPLAKEKQHNYMEERRKSRLK